MQSWIITMTWRKSRSPPWVVAPLLNRVFLAKEDSDTVMLHSWLNMQVLSNPFSLFSLPEVTSFLRNSPYVNALTLWRRTGSPFSGLCSTRCQYLPGGFLCLRQKESSFPLTLREKRREKEAKWSVSGGQRRWLPSRRLQHKYKSRRKREREKKRKAVEGNNDEICYSGLKWRIPDARKCAEEKLWILHFYLVSLIP